MILVVCKSGQPLQKQDGLPLHLKLAPWSRMSFCVEAVLFQFWHIHSILWKNKQSLVLLVRFHLCLTTFYGALTTALMWDWLSEAVRELYPGSGVFTISMPVHCPSVSPTVLDSLSLFFPSRPSLGKTQTKTVKKAPKKKTTSSAETPAWGPLSLSAGRHTPHPQPNSNPSYVRSPHEHKNTPWSTKCCLHLVLAFDSSHFLGCGSLNLSHCVWLLWSFN